MGATKVGKTLGNFRILECLGSGGAGMIWKAEDLSLGRIVALKALRAELAADSGMAQRFRDEARTLAKLSHANVASLYSLIEDDDGLFLVLEYVEGNTLAALLATSGPLPLDSAFALFHQVLDGVGHAHDAGIVHRDLKPANLMVDARGRVKVMDFGIARVAGAARTTHHGKLVGTPEYMSPEQVRGEDATIRSDIYSLGILLFEMVAGQPPFRSAATFEVMRAQLESAPPNPRALRPELDERIAAAILRSLAKRPADRFATTRELQDVLLDAGASRRGRGISPVWRNLPPAASASEAPTLVRSASALAPARPGAVSAPVPAEGQTEPLEMWNRAVDALDEDIDAALAGGGQPAARSAAATRASATVVMDATQDTAKLELVRPTRMLEGAPFAVHAQSLGATPRAARPSRFADLLWIALAAALIGLAVGAVHLRPGQDSAPAEAPLPARRAVREPHEAAPPSSSPSTAPPSAERSVAPESERSRKGAPARVTPRARPPASRPGATPEAPESHEESGWVIRR
jgi:serine/threonine-protein kinase